MILKKPKIKLTKRKFYNKWLYKVTLEVGGAAVFRHASFDKIKEYVENSKGHGHEYALSSKVYSNRNLILKLTDYLESKDPKSYSKRIESSLFDFYTNDKEFYEEISTEFESVLIQKFEPSEKGLSILDEPNKVHVKKLPHGIYNFRVYLLPHKITDKSEKEKYMGWVRSQNPRIRCSEVVEDWFIKTNWNWDPRYVLVEDEKTLLMLKLRNSEAVGRIYNFIVSDK